MGAGRVVDDDRATAKARFDDGFTVVVFSCGSVAGTLVGNVACASPDLRATRELRASCLGIRPNVDVPSFKKEAPLGWGWDVAEHLPGARSVVLP